MRQVRIKHFSQRFCEPTLPCVAEFGGDTDSYRSVSGSSLGEAGEEQEEGESSRMDERRDQEEEDEMETSHASEEGGDHESEGEEFIHGQDYHIATAGVELRSSAMDLTRLLELCGANGSLPPSARMLRPLLTPATPPPPREQ
jgi:hypothetical protein